MLRLLGIALDLVHIAGFKAVFLHVCTDVLREPNCEIVPAHIVYSYVDVHASGTQELVTDPATGEA